MAGLPYQSTGLPALAVDEETRRQVYDQAWADGGLHMLLSTFVDLMWDDAANDTVADYVREQIAHRVEDPAKAALLTPTDHPYATKRPPFESSYYEAFNHPHVEIVDVREAPISEVTPTGVRTSAGVHEVDVIILAIGFDAFTGATTALPTVGRGGTTIQDKWADGPANYLGMVVADFPNFFNIVGPLTVASQYNTPLLIEEQVDFVAGAVQRVLDDRARTIEAIPEAEKAWVDLVNGTHAMSLFAKAPRSWYSGGNIEGKPNTAYVLPIGAPFYMAALGQAAATGYAGFAVDGRTRPLPPLVRLDPAAALTIAVMMNSGATPLDQCTVDDVRALNETLPQMQLPGPEMRVKDLVDPAVRLYLPEAAEPLPVVLFFHGGGFIAGSLDSVDPLCRSTADRLGAIVVSVDYRIAPEHPCPAAPDDALTALRWVREHIEEFGGDPGRIAVMGDSAGATLAAVTALRARDEGIPLVAQVLVNPAVDVGSSTDSMTEFAHGPFLTAAAGERFWSLYLAGGPITPLAAPARADSLGGLAPALVTTMELDPIRDEGEHYARALGDAGVEVEHHRMDGLFHGTFAMNGRIPHAQELHEIVGRFLAPRLQRIGQPD